MIPDQQLAMDPNLPSLWNDAAMQVISTCQKNANPQIILKNAIILNK
jgi:hypothetical protein